jgi:predicted transcriptional regulator
MGNYDRLLRIIRTLEQAELVEISSERKPKVSYKVRLTEKGEKIAKKYEEIDAILKSGQ